MSAGNGGQVLLSKATRTLVDVEAVDLGEHRLKDFDQPVWLYQLGQAAHPPLRSLNNTNLPHPASSFRGRESELEAAGSLVVSSRVVTVLSPGGIGKTRFAIELARTQLARFPNGVFWVSLGSLRDPGLVADAIAQMLGARSLLAQHIGERRMLLVLDNFEHLVEAAGEISELLRACPNLAVLVTSRELLRLDGERGYPLPPLKRDEAVALFCDRADVADDEVIAELCSGLDDLPLAIELAAAQLSILTPVQLRDRLSRRLDLASGRRDVDDRQHTIRATIEWSHERLAPAEQQLFARLAVFAGGCQLDAAEVVCDADTSLLDALRAKSPIQYEDGRLSFLETIREYAGERLGERPEAEALARRHAEWLAALAAEARPALEGQASRPPG